MSILLDLRFVEQAILGARASVPAGRSVLAAISGIDGCGKGYVAARVTDVLRGSGIRATAVNIDGWLNLPRKRFKPSNPAEHFYLHALRFDEMFSQLVLPLRDRRSLSLEADYAEETAAEYRRHRYEFAEVDVVVLEGIYLLRRELRRHYDVSFWIECSYDTALERAVARRQEGLSAKETVRAYRTIYFPAQEIHLERDDPKGAATAVIRNDPRLGGGGMSASGAG